MASASGGASPPKEPPLNCPSCGYANAMVARFCGGCGKALFGKALPEAERNHRHADPA